LVIAMSATISIHGIKTVSAEASPVTDGLILNLPNESYWDGDTTINLYAGDRVLSERLAHAINKVVAERAAELEAAKHHETEAA
jgi:hypothetical protein